MKRSRTEKSPWIKSEAKPGPKKKKIDEFHPDRMKNLAESDKGSWFNEPSESEADGASSLGVCLVLRSMLWSRLRAKKSPSNLIKCKRSMLGMFVLS